MTTQITATHDDNLTAQIVSRTPLEYSDEAPEDLERPPHVRAASSLAPLGEYLAVIQDDAQFLAVVHPQENTAESIKLPSGDEHDDDFAGEKLDLEACVAVPGTQKQLLVAFGSGSRESREWIMTVDWRAGGAAPEIELHHADSLFNYLRTQKEFVGAGLNIEGAAFPDDDTLRLYQRGNFSSDDQPSIDATADLDWSDVLEYLEAEATETPPEISNIVQYDLGEVAGASLNFSDAERVEEVILFSASAESGTTGENAGSALGIIDGEEVRWSQVRDQAGDIFAGKIEGLRVNPDDLAHAWFVIDADDPDNPSEIFEVKLSGPWY